MLAIFFVVQAYVGFCRAAYQEAVLRTDDRSDYFEFQDIIRAVNMSKPPWFYGHNFETGDWEGKVLKNLLESATSCTYFRKESINKTDVDFTKHFKENGNMTSRHLYGTFFTTPGIGENSAPKNRSVPNSIAVSASPGGKPEMWFKLLYSDNQHCSIFRPFFLEQFHNAPLIAQPGTPVQNVPYLSYYDESLTHYRSTKGLCVVLLSDERARKGVLPRRCSATYPNMCGKARGLTVVFDPSCPHIPNVLGC